MAELPRFRLYNRRQTPLEQADWPPIVKQQLWPQFARPQAKLACDVFRFKFSNFSLKKRIECLFDKSSWWISDWMGPNLTGRCKFLEICDLSQNCVRTNQKLWRLLFEYSLGFLKYFVVLFEINLF